MGFALTIICWDFAIIVIFNNSAQKYFWPSWNKKRYSFIAMSRADSKIFIAYEDSGSFSAISKFESFLGAVSPIPNREKTDVLNFSEFWAEESWARAVTAVTRADMIIVSLSGSMDLPVPVRRWMEAWPNYEQVNHVTLVVVFKDELTDGVRQNVLISYFQEVAKNHGLDFLCPCDRAKTLPVTPESLPPSDTTRMARAEPYSAFDLLAAPKAA
jgi:hypothetical protein